MKKELIVIFIILIVPLILAETLEDSSSINLESSKGSSTLSSEPIKQSNSFNNYILLILAIIVIGAITFYLVNLKKKKGKRNKRK
jgi:hypothetical protein